MKALLTMGLLIFSLLTAQAQQIIWLDPPVQNGRISVWDVTVVNGMPVVVGRASFEDPQRGIYVDQAFLWTPDDGFIRLGALDSLGIGSSEARGISSDGRFVVGWADNSSGVSMAFLWSQETGMQSLGFTGVPEAVSLDGSVVVGRIDSAGGRAFRWTASEGMQIIGSNASAAFDVSSDGSTIVGTHVISAEPGSGYFAFRWTPDQGLENLNLRHPPFGTLALLIEARAISPNGRYIVGVGGRVVESESVFEPFLIDTTQGAAVWLGFPPPSGPSFFFIQADDVSADGSVVVGVAMDGTRTQFRAYRWTASGGAEDLNVAYASLLPPGAVLINASAVSPDGRFIVGQAAFAPASAFLLDTRVVTAVDEAANPLMQRARLYQNYPNPFNPLTTIRFSLQERKHVTLKVFDVLGKEVATLADEEFSAGEHTVLFEARDLPSGIYFVQLKTGDTVQRIRTILMK